jgi:N-acylneuraminate cytidylyltransferase
MSAVAIIPARGGSKRIPHKNIIDFHGKPMIAWTIEAAKKAGIFEKVYVSTDETEIAKIAMEHGANIVIRKGYSDDQTTVQTATINTLKQIERENNETYDTVVQLMACCPLRTDREIQQSYLTYIITKTKFQLSCVEFDFMNPWWASKLDKYGKPDPLFPEALKQRSQDLPKLYCVTGVVWIANIQALYEANTFYGKDYTMFPLPLQASIDIDEYKDLELAKLMYFAGKGTA